MARPKKIHKPAENLHAPTITKVMGWQDEQEPYVAEPAAAPVKRRSREEMIMEWLTPLLEQVRAQGVNVNFHSMDGGNIVLSTFAQESGTANRAEVLHYINAGAGKDNVRAKMLELYGKHVS